MTKEIKIFIQVIFLLCFSMLKANEKFTNKLKEKFDAIVETNKVNERLGLVKDNNYILVLSGDYISGDYKYLKIDNYDPTLHFIKDQRNTEFSKLSKKLTKANDSLSSLGKKDRVYAVIGENHFIPVRLKEYYDINNKNAFKHFFTKHKGERSFFDKEKWDETLQNKSSSQLLKDFSSYRKDAYNKLVSKITENQENVLLVSQFNFILTKKEGTNQFSAIARYGFKNVKRAKGDSKEIKEHLKNYLTVTKKKASLFSFCDALFEYANNGLTENNKISEDYCSGFTLIDELRKEDIRESTEILEKAISTIQGNKNKILPKGTLHHFYGVDLSTKIEKNKLQALEDKLQLLSKKTNKHVIVNFLNLRNNTKYNDNLLVQLAETSLSQANNVDGKDIVYLIFSHSTYESILWESRDKTCYNFGFSQSSKIVDIDTDIRTHFSGMILNIFKGIKKPLNVFGVTKLTDGTIVKLYTKSGNNVTGFPLINGLVLLESPHYETLRKIISDKPKLPEETTEEEYEKAIAEYNQKYKKWLALYNKVKREGMAEDRDKMDSQNKGKDYFKRSSGEIKLRECYITKESYDNHLILDYAQYHHDDKEYSWITGLAYHLGAYNKLNDDLHLLEDLDVTKYVYQAVDTASLLLAPFGADIIADTVGFVYATFIDSKKDSFQIGSYGASIFAVGLSEYLVKAEKFAYKGYKAIGNIDEAGNVISISAQLDNYVPSSNQVELSTLLAKNEKEAEAILKQDLPFYYRGDKINISNAKEFLLSSLEKKYKTTLGDQWDNFVRDFGGDIDALKKFNSDDKLVESLKLNYDLSGEKPSVELLEFISKKFDAIQSNGEIGLLSARNTIETKIDIKNGEHSIFSTKNDNPLLSEKELANGWFVENKSDVVEFTVTTKYGNPKQKIGFGEELRFRIFEDLGGKNKINAIETEWIGKGGGLDENLNKFNEVLKGRTDIESIREAALATPSGQWNKKLGYDKVEIVGTPTITGGEYSVVRFKFSKKLANGVDELADILKPLKNKYADAVLDALKKDFPDATDLKRIVDDGLVDSWKYFKNGNVPDEIRTSPEWLQKLSDDLDNTKYNLKELFDESPGDIEIWKSLKEDPYYYRQMIDEGSLTDGRWTKWSQREFFTEVTKAGKQFEGVVSNSLSTIPRFKSFIDDGFLHLKQVYLKGDNVIIADDILIKLDVDEFGDDIYKAVINDSKLSSASPWTANQKSELINKFKNDPTLDYIDFEVRTNTSILKEQGAPVDFVQGGKLRIYRDDVFKTISDGNNGVSEVVKMSDVNFR